MKGWNSHVYRTDVTPEAYVGFFFDDAEAEGWIKKQEDGTYEVSPEKPRERKPSVAPEAAAEEARSE